MYAFRRRLRAASICLLVCLALTTCVRAEDEPWSARLADLGYYPQASEAPMDEQTRLALSNFQRANSLEITGAPDRDTVEKLTSEASLSKEGYLRALSARYSDRELQNGAYGEDVKSLQAALKELGCYAGRRDGAFGAETEEAVKLFQLQVGLSATGVADAGTLYRLFEGENLTREAYISQMTAGYGDQGNKIKLLQQALRALGYFRGDCTGAYGSMTHQAVLLFQMCNDLTPTGEANYDTCACLYSTACQPLPASAEALSTIDGVINLQRALQELGYYRGEINGLYDAETELSDLLSALAQGEARLPLMQARSALEASRDSVSLSQLNRVAEQAEDMLGSHFAAEGEDSGFAGFRFVALLYARQGIGFAEPSDIAGGIRAFEEESAPAPGSILLYKEESDARDDFHLGIVLPDGALALHEEDTVARREISSLQLAGAWVWSAGAVR